MGAIPFRLHLPDDASPARRAAQSRYEAAVNAMSGPRSSIPGQFELAMAEYDIAQAGYRAALLDEDKARRPEIYRTGPAPRMPLSRDIGLMICLRLEDQPVTINDWDDDSVSVVATDHIAVVDVSDADRPIIITDSGARFRVCITREG
jgi:hypothetical protein